MSALDTISEILNAAGLGSLVPWATRQLQEGRSATQVMQSLREQPEYEARFPAIKERERKGLPPIGPQEYLAYERAAQQLFRHYGLPPGMFDRPDDFAELIANDVSPEELNRRIEAGYAQVDALPVEVQDWFGEKYGAKGKRMLAAFYLDPDRAMPDLMRETQAAAFGGVGRMFGVDVGRDVAERAARTGVTMEDASRGFEQLNATRELYTDSVSDVERMSLADQGVRAAFGLDGKAQEQVQARRRRRAASFAGRADFVSEQSGITGLGSATNA